MMDAMAQGEWKAGKKNGHGIHRDANGDFEVGFNKAGVRVGEGMFWSKSSETAWRMRDGKRMEEISRDEASRIAAEHGFEISFHLSEESLFGASAVRRRDS